MNLKASFLTFSGLVFLNFALYLIVSHLRSQVALLSFALSSPTLDASGFMRLANGLQSLAVSSLLLTVFTYLLLRFGVSLLLLGCSGRLRL
ncbi:hypothetical protein DRO24_02730 [Candidatus Bathyarchaeota archaeon]|nr:MAG: hypothetical protein DRO24_02730 [Candidatus Bathyarchaeota archaeon]